MDNLVKRQKNDIHIVVKKLSIKVTPKNTKLKPDTRQMIKERKNLQRNTQEYSELNRQITKKTRQDVRRYNTERIIQVIENNKNMKILKELQTGKVRINQIIDKEGNVQHDKSRIMAVIQEYYEELYSSNQANPIGEHRTNIMNVGSEDVLEISIQEIELALKLLKTGRAPEEDGVTVEMLKLGGDALLKAIGTLLNKCLQSNKIPEQWQNA